MSLKKKPRAHAMRDVLSFTFRHWGKQPRLAIFIALAMSGATLTEIFVPVVAGNLIDALVQNQRESILGLFVAMGALGLGMVVMRHAAWMSVISFTMRIMSDIANQTFHRVQRFSTDWHANTFAGSTVRKITRGMWAIDMLNDTILLALVPSMVVLTGTMILLAAQAPLLGIVMAVGAVLYVSLTVTLATRLVAPAASLSNTWDTRMSGALADSISSNAVVKAFGAETREEHAFARLIDKWRRRTDRTWTLGTWSGSTQIALLWVVRLALIGASLYLWFQGEASPGDVAYVLTSYFIMHGYLRDIGQHVQHLQRSVNDMEEMVAMYDQPLGIEDRPGAQPARLSAGEVKFDAVTFRYGGHETALFKDLSVLIRGGERVGLVGHSGSGKTTFVKLIQRLYDVTDGRVLVDGQDVRSATQQSLRSQIAIVQQEPILFHRSLAENISYARPSASRAEIEHAATLANAHDFIVRLPKAYDTLVGERGVKLSGGERQRVALARAFLADAPILILDEATSSLDSESEALIQEAIVRLMKGRTAIIIAHRLSTVRALDRILVFDRGQVVEDGNHEALLANPGGLYRRLFDRQAGAIKDPLILIDAPSVTGAAEPIESETAEVDQP
jgi:ATP-binding cassette subfamily B protein